MTASSLIAQPHLQTNKALVENETCPVPPH
jgi:hypothetical protein